MRHRKSHCTEGGERQNSAVNQRAPARRITLTGVEGRHSIKGRPSGAGRLFGEFRVQRPLSQRSPLLADCSGYQVRKFPNGEKSPVECAAAPGIRMRLLKNGDHLPAKGRPIWGWKEMENPSVEAEQHGYASLGDERRLARRVSCFIRATSASRICRPLGVSR